MGTVKSGSFTSIILQVLLLIAGIALILSNNYWNRGPAVTASGIFFINLFWITIVLSHDLKVWSLLRNTKTGGLILLGILILNLLSVFILAIAGDFFRR